MKNDNPFRVWNSDWFKDDPFAPHNGVDKDDPFKAWNDPLGDEDDLTESEKRYYGIRGRKRDEEEDEEY